MDVQTLKSLLVWYLLGSVFFALVISLIWPRHIIRVILFFIINAIILGANEFYNPLELNKEYHELFKNSFWSWVLEFVMFIGGFCWFQEDMEQKPSEETRFNIFLIVCGCIVLGGAGASWHFGNIAPLFMSGFIFYAVFLFGSQYGGVEFFPEPTKEQEPDSSKVKRAGLVGAGAKRQDSDSHKGGGWKTAPLLGHVARFFGAGGKRSDDDSFKGDDWETAPLLGHIDGKPLTYAGERHLCTFAPNGSGKFSTVQAPVLMTLDRPVFCIDPKGQAAAVTARRRREMGHKVITLNPFGLHGLPRHRFNPLASLDRAAPSFVADVARLVDGLIEQTGKESPFWSNSARDLFTWLIMWTVIHEGEKTLSTVRDLLCLPERYFCEVAEKAAADDYPPLRNKAAAFVGNKTASGFVELSGELRGVISTAKAETRIFDDPAIRESLGGSDFDFAELKKGKTSVYVVLPADFLGSHAKWLRVVVMSALSSMYRNPEGERVLFLLDEAFSLGYMSDLEKAAGLVRGYGVQLWLFFQDYSQIHGLYGERSETFLANAGITQVFTANDPSTAAYFSKRSGEKTVWRTTKGSNSKSCTETKEPLFSTYDILGLPENEQLIFKDGMGAAILANKTPDYFKPGSGFAGMYDVDPYHKPQGSEARPGATVAGDMAEAPA